MSEPGQIAPERRELPPDVAEFLRRHDGNGMWVTRALSAALVAMFVLEWRFGGTGDLLVLARMGAFMPDRVRDGESWRLLSSAFLHAGPIHLGGNLLVLWFLGGALERLLGPARFLLLWGAAALLGNLGGLVVANAPISVGASGAGWGILAAEAVLAVRPHGLLVAELLPRFRKAALVNLGLNVGISFLPNVDWVAHLGGGLVGAALVGSGALIAGVPALPARDARPGELPARRPRTPAWIVTGAVLSGALCVLAVSAALATGRAWDLLEPDRVHRVELPGTNLSAAVPALLRGPEVSRAHDGTRIVGFGDLEVDPAAINVTVFPLPAPIPDDAYAAQLDDLERRLRARKDGFADTPEVRRVTLGRRGGFVVTAKLANGLVFEEAYLLEPKRLLKVEAAIRPDRADAYPGLAERILRSLRVSDTGV